MNADIIITKMDKDRIAKILEKMSDNNQPLDKTARKLVDELSRAIVVESHEIPADVITMNTKALLQLDKDDYEVSLVYPEEADLNGMKLSVFSPIGTAIIGYREGNTVEWEVPDGTSKILIKKIIYQPEAAGDYNL